MPQQVLINCAALLQQVSVCSVAVDCKQPRAAHTLLPPQACAPGACVPWISQAPRAPGWLSPHTEMPGAHLPKQGKSGFPAYGLTPGFPGLTSTSGESLCGSWHGGTEPGETQAPWALMNLGLHPGTQTELRLMQR